MKKVTIEIASAKDDAALRQLTNAIPVPGNIALLFKKEPSFLSAMKVLGQETQIGIARDLQSDAIVGLGTRSIKAVYVNGKVQDIGYLSNLRLEHQYRNRLLLTKGYQFLRVLHQDQQVNFYLTTMMEDNLIAKKILTSGRANLPIYQDYGLYKTYTIMVRRQLLKEKDMAIEIPEKKDADELLQFINQVGPEKQFFPHYTKQDLITEGTILHGIKLNNFRIAKINNKIVGTIVIWDQRQFKQTMVHSYHATMKFIKPLYNIYVKLKKLPPLPVPGTIIPMFYASMIVIKDNNPEIFEALLTSIYNTAVKCAYSHFIVGLHETDSLNIVTRKFQHILLKSRLFLVYWPEDKEVIKLADKIPYLEVGAL